MIILYSALSANGIGHEAFSRNSPPVPGSLPGFNVVLHSVFRQNSYAAAYHDGNKYSIYRAYRNAHAHTTTHANAHRYPYSNANAYVYPSPG